ncbi:PPOX class F420-dependent oxidoreductase [Egibacter rhizosphaerae]|uniref:PPOX class F420-dependent oxidoreductase n=1 Tax=Egibacter rhizosphaerae TaxID=1670831 RepID=A0A411YBL4_9ACTN|nr:PPOX class F420-dependent oxidoreductase [Egibacter rhizosphaerae]QBI18547.1 PPOX class F420-dependent oxidoreductase [Egibacter rhizosphaerae]
MDNDGNAAIPGAAYDLFDEPNFAHVVTLFADGMPHVTPMWQERQGDSVLLNTNQGRLKTRNIARDPRVSLSVQDRKDPFRYVQVRGLAELKPEGGQEDIDRLSIKYVGEPFRPLKEGEVRVSIVIRPSRVQYAPTR